ncbi:unnamed protein product [Allacma fusca]|uniref:HAP1 N-terminal domain-containing protein n=1 Tax=Allacma fusca TaxID=39272 RepID=A0A8J2P6D4_9HEXA|nr:unnamed protein product [Allacma fusca]
MLEETSCVFFYSCPNEDFVGIPYPVLSDFSPVTPEQAYLTLGYFLLSGQRVSQMTKTFADVDALQRLLEEKEKDLELAARIGQQLLEQNGKLEDRVNVLEVENRETHEQLTQLKHDLFFKTQLLELYNNDCCNSEESSKAGTPVGSVATVLERRVAALEEENQCLRTEACRIAEDVEKTEAEEKYLVEDAIKRLAEVNSNATRMSDDLKKKTEETIRQNEELLILMDETKALQEVNRELLEDNASLTKTVETLQTCQTELTTELADLKDNYVEIVAILKETQEQLREAQKQRDSGVDVVSVFDSLAYEIESSVARQRRTSDYFRRTFDTVRCAHNKLNDANLSSSALMSSVSSLGYQSLQGSSCLSSLESSQDVSNLSLMNPCQSLTISGSDLGSSICPSPNGSTPASDKFGWKMPEKLQIVKPLEGSATLQIWSSLATPNLGNLLDRRPGVQTRTERPVGEIGMQNILSLTAPEATTIQNIVSTPTVFTFVTTSSKWDRRESTTTIYSSDLSNLSTCSLASCRSESPTPSACSSVVSNNTTGEFGTSEHHLYLKCDTPQNSPMDGNSRPSSPTHTVETNNRTFKTLFSVYESLCTSLKVMGSQSSNAKELTKSKKFDLMSKIGPFVEDCNNFQTPPHVGSETLEEDFFSRY